MNRRFDTSERQMVLLREEMAGFKADVRGDMASFKAEMREDITSFKAEMRDGSERLSDRVDRELRAIKAQMAMGFASLKESIEESSRP